MSEDFSITIHREQSGAVCTSGYLEVDGTVICYTLERPWAENLENLSSIPPGTYAAKLRYDHADHWRIELINVPDRSNVQIHIGNEPDESKGCILVGKTLDVGLCSLGGSAHAYAELKAAFYGTSSPDATPDKTITVAVVDVGPQ